MINKDKVLICYYYLFTFTLFLDLLYFYVYAVIARVYFADLLFSYEVRRFSGRYVFCYSYTFGYFLCGLKWV
ncbi:hypothetical protein BDC45DRAFT_525537 [Circinella umbellata]|nr:hypothetical protein BDC45DRAFT_525537 [Circinella umbellata]